MIAFPLFGDGIFTQEGADWKHAREMLRPQFNYRQYEDLSVFREHVDNLLNCIYEANGQDLDLQPLFFRFTLDTTTAFLFGESVYSLKNKERAAEFEKAFDLAQTYIAKRFRLLDFYWLIGGKEFNNACTSIYKFVDNIIAYRPSSKSQNEDGRYVFLDAIAQYNLKQEALRYQLLNILIAGRDTTACLLSWTL
jgi:cytochrome P450